MPCGISSATMIKPTTKRSIRSIALIGALTSPIHPQVLSPTEIALTFTITNTPNVSRATRSDNTLKELKMNAPRQTSVMFLPHWLCRNLSFEPLKLRQRSTGRLTPNLLKLQGAYSSVTPASRRATMVSIESLIVSTWPSTKPKLHSPT